MNRLVPALLAVIVLSGCALGPNYQRPAVPSPEAWRTPTDRPGSLAEGEWWDLFQDQTLQDLVRIALQESTNVRLAVARVAEARALLAVTRAAQFPQLDATGVYARQRVSEVSAPPLPPGIDPEAHRWNGGLDLSYEVDLWGRLRRSTEAARAELLASEEAHRAVLITLVSDVALGYFDLRDLDRELEIARRSVVSRRESLRIVQLRFREGLTAELDLRRAEGELAAASAVVPDLERRIAQGENRLSILLGRNPGAIARGKPLAEQAPILFT